jgi:hypothetical protein
LFPRERSTKAPTAPLPTYLYLPAYLPTVPARLGRVFRAEGVPTTLPGQASRGRAEAAGGEASRGGGGARAGCLPALEERFLGPKFLLPLEEILGRSSCLPGRKMDRAFLLALEEGSWVRFLLALEEGLGSARSCLPGRRFGCEALPALEEDGPSVFACPGGEEGRDLGRLLVGLLLAREEGWCADGGRVLLALEESGLCALACLGGGTGGMSCLPGRRLGVPAGLSSSRVGRVGDGVGCGAWCLEGFVLGERCE